MKPSRCKMRVDAVTQDTYQEKVFFVCEYDETNPEEKAFSEATPSGNLTISVTNKALKGNWKPGDRVYINIAKADN